jgi:hypothetical protein
MPQDNIDLTPAQVDKLSNSINSVAYQAQGVGAALNKASLLLEQTVKDAAAASDRHAKALVRATWWLVYVTAALVLITAIQACLAMLPLIYGSSIVSSDVSVTLYRGSMVGGGEMRVHVATFDAAEREDYNQNNCEIARGLFASQSGVKVTYWCEKGRYKK